MSGGTLLKKIPPFRKRIRFVRFNTVQRMNQLCSVEVKVGLVRPLSAGVAGRMVAVTVRISGQSTIAIVFPTLILNRTLQLFWPDQGRLWPPTVQSTKESLDSLVLRAFFVLCSLIAVRSASRRHFYGTIWRAFSAALRACTSPYHSAIGKPCFFYLYSCIVLANRAILTKFVGEGYWDTMHDVYVSIWELQLVLQPWFAGMSRPLKVKPC